MVLDIKGQLDIAAEKIENALNAYLNFYDCRNGLTEAMKYAVLGGGKRIRAFLTLSFAKMFGASEESAIPFACALEMVHAYSLIHDDLPCMDNDDMRRGKPSCHKKFGEATALLAGDSLLTYAFEVCADNRYVSDKSIRLAVKALAQLAGYSGMCGGQEIDLTEVPGSIEELKRLHAMKTGALMRAACLLGLYTACTNPDEKVIRDISIYAESVGLAFQIHDDILDVTSDTETLGKPVGSDAKNDKKTVLSFMNAEKATEEEYSYTLKAIEAISDYTDSEVPCQLAVWLMSRKK